MQTEWMAGFKRWAVLRRASDDAKDFVLSSWWGLALMAAGFAFVGAFFTVGDSDWGSRFMSGLVSAGLAVVLVVGGVFLWKLYAYRASQYRHPNWETVAFHDAEGVLFVFRRRADGMPQQITDLGLCLLIIRTPGGEYLSADDDGNRRWVEAFSTHFEGLKPGTYEVRWYGSRRPNRYYEILRGSVTTQAAPT